MSGERFERNGIEKDDGLSVDSWHSVIREGETQYIQLQVKVRFAVDHTLQVMLGGENGEMKLSEKRRKAEIRKAEFMAKRGTPDYVCMWTYPGLWRREALIAFPGSRRKRP